MRLGLIGRAVLLALFVVSINIGPALAHALPKAVLTFTQTDQQLQLTITLPVEDLVIAYPALEGLESAALEEGLSPQHLADLAAYFSDHLALHHGAAGLALTLESARILQDENEHVGTFRVLIMDWTGTLPDAAGDLTLTYDAVMHEVRNHRAEVYWTGPDALPVGLVEFGYRSVNGAQQPVVLQRP